MNWSSPSTTAGSPLMRPAPEALEKLNEAGAQTIIDEVARQLQEWKASNE